MDVDEPGGDDPIGGVDDAARTAPVDLADDRDAIAVDPSMRETRDNLNQLIADGRGPDSGASPPADRSEP